MFLIKTSQKRNKSAQNVFVTFFIKNIFLLFCAFFDYFCAFYVRTNMYVSPTQFFFSTPPLLFLTPKKASHIGFFLHKPQPKIIATFPNCVRKSEFILTLLPRGLLRATFPQLRKTKNQHLSTDPIIPKRVLRRLLTQKKKKSIPKNNSFWMYCLRGIFISIF